MPNGFNEQFERWRQQLEIAQTSLREQELKLEELQEPLPAWKVIFGATTLSQIGYLIGRLTAPNIFREIKVREAETIKTEYLETLDAYQRASWFTAIYSATPSDLQLAGITNFDDWVAKHPPEPDTPTEDLAAARNYINSILGGRPTTATTEGGLAEWFLTTPLETKPRFEGVHVTTVEEIVKWLKKDVAPAELPAGLESAEMLEYLREAGITDEERAEAAAHMSPWLAKIEAWEEGRAQIAEFKAGVEVEMPEEGFGDKLKRFGSQPALVFMEVARAYAEHWEAPMAAQMHLLPIFARPDKVFFWIPEKDIGERSEHQAELYDLYRSNVDNGMSYWSALTKAWQDWEQPAWKKIMSEVVLDPLNLIGFGWFMKIAKGLKSVPVLGKIAGAMGAFEYGFIKAGEFLPVLAKKGIMKIPKSTGQRVALAEATTEASIRCGHEKHFGLPIDNIPDEKFIPYNTQSVDYAIANPDVLDWQANLGRAYLQRPTMDRGAMVKWAGLVGSSLGPDDISPAMLADFERIVDGVRLPGSRNVALGREEASQIICRQVLGVDDSIDNMKVVGDLLEGTYNDVITAGRAMAGQPKVRSIRMAVRTAQDVVRSEAYLNTELWQMRHGFWAAVQRDIAQPVINAWRDHIDRQLIMPFARAYLITGSYAPYNWVEEVFRTFFGRGGGIYGKNAPLRLQDIGVGLIYETRLVVGARRLSTMAYRDVLKAPAKPGWGWGPGEISEAALLREAEQEVSKPVLERALLLGWLPKRFNAVHEAMYYPVRSSQLAGMVQRSGYLTTRYLDELRTIAVRQMDEIDKVITTAGKVTINGVPARAMKAFYKSIADAATVGPDAVEKVAKKFTRRNIKLAEANEAIAKYANLGDCRESFLAALERGEAWDDIYGYGEKLRAAKAQGLIDGPEAKAITYENLVTDLIEGKAIRDTYTLMDTVKAYREMVDYAPEVISDVFTGFQRKIAHLPTGRPREEAWVAAYDRIYPFMDAADTQAKRLSAYIEANIGDLLTDAQKVELKRYMDVTALRIQELKSTRTAAMKRSDEMIRGINTGGRGKVHPNSDYWRDELNHIWDEHFLTDAIIAGNQWEWATVIDEAVSRQKFPIPKVDATTTGLTPAHVAKIFYTTGDQLSHSAMHSAAMMRKVYFRQQVIARANRMAKVHGTTREALGFTDEAIDGVHDQIIYGLRSDPKFHDVLTEFDGEMDNLCRDLESIRINNSMDADATRLLEGHVKWVADGLRELDIYKKPMVEAIPAEKVIPVTPEVTTFIAAFDRSYAKAFAGLGKVPPDHAIGLRGVAGELGMDFNSPAFKGRVEEMVKEGTFKFSSTREAKDNILVRMPGILHEQSIGLVRRPVAIPKVGVPEVPAKPPVRALPGEGSEEWWKLKQESMDKAMKEYYKDFTDYTNLNIVDAAMRHIFPYWVYESQRWFWLARNFATHPGVFNVWGRTMDNSDFGYWHVPGTNLEVNVTRGTVYKGGLSTLVRRDYPEYYDQYFPEFFEAMDYAQRFGFFPNVFWNLIATSAGGRKPQWGQVLPAVARTPLDLYVAANPKSESAHFIQNKLFPDRFREYQMICEVSHLATDDQIQRGINGASVWDRIETNAQLTDEEQELWDRARKNVSTRGPLLEHGGIFRIRHTDRIEAYEWFGKFIEEKTGVSSEMQGTLRRYGYSVGDVCEGLSQLNIAQVQEAEEYMRWISPRVTATLRPSNEIEDNLILGEFWGHVRRNRKDGHERMRVLESQAVGGLISWKDYVDQVGTITSDNAKFLHRLHGDKYNDLTGLWEADPASRSKYAMVPITLQQRSDYYTERGVNLSMSTFDEMLAIWHELSPRKKIDPVTGTLETDWGTYFAVMDLLEKLMPEDLKVEWDTYMSLNDTPGWLMYRDAVRGYIVPYWNVADVIKAQFSPDEQSLIDEYYRIRDIDPHRAEEIKDYVMPSGLKLISQYTSKVSDGRSKLRQAVPMVDAQLRFWGKTQSFLTPEAEVLYNQLVEQSQMLY